MGVQPAISDELLAAGRVISGIVEEALPASVRSNPLWQSREAVWRGEREVSGPLLDRPPQGAYPERDAPSVVVPPSKDAPALAPAAQPPVEDAATLARGVLFEGGHLAVLRHGAYLTLREDRLVVRVRGGDLATPELGSVKTVMVSGLGTGVSSSLARWLARAEVPLVLASPMDTDVSVLASPHAGSPAVRFGQVLHAHAAPVCRAGLAMLDAKVNGQASLLRYYAKYRRRCGDALHESLDQTARTMRALAEKIVALDPGEWDRARRSAMGYEGAAAAAYWSAVAELVPSELGFPGRRTRGAEDPVNQSLNYVYGCLYAEVWRALATAGLDPCVGIIHGSDRGDASLVFDLVEELRPAFGDRLVLSLLGRGFRPSVSVRDVLSTASRRVLSRAFRKVALRPIQWRGKATSFERLVQSQARQLAAICRSGVGRYHAYHLRW